MRSNKQELFALASQTSQNFDREGVIIVQERHSFFRRSEDFTARWFRLRGNLLFYLKGPEPWYEPLGVIVLGNHQVKVQPQDEHGHWPFRLVWENGVCYCLATFLEAERALWLRAMANAPYETLTQRIAELQQQLDDTRTMIDLKKYRTTNKIINDFNEVPLCELSLSCDNLPCDANGNPPSAFATVFAVFKEKALCVRYGCTEVVEKCSNPNFLRTIMFRESDGINSGVMIRILVYDMREMVSQTGVAIGSVNMLLCHIQEAQRLRVPLLTTDDKVVGFVTFNGWSLEPDHTATSAAQPSNPERHTIDLNPTVPAHRRSQSMPARMGLKLQYPAYSMLIRQNFLNPHQTTYRFHSGLGGDITVHEALAEPSFCFTMPIQLVDIFLLREQELSESMVAFTEVSRRVSPRLMDLVGNHITIMRLMQGGKLAEEHEKTHSSAIMELDAAKSKMLNHSIYFKPSIRKVDDIPEEPGLAYVPVNLHIQRMWAHNETLNKWGFHDIITVGAFTAHTHTAAKPGGLIRLLQQSKDLSSRQADMTGNSNRLDAEFDKLRVMKNLQNILVTHMDSALLLLHKGFLYNMQNSMIGIRQNVKQILDMWNIEATEEALSKVGWNKKRIDFEEAEKRKAENIALQKRLQSFSYRSGFADAAITTVAALTAPSITHKGDITTSMEAVVNGADGVRTAAGVTIKVAEAKSVNNLAQAVPKPGDVKKGAGNKRTAAESAVTKLDSVKLADTAPDTAKMPITPPETAKLAVTPSETARLEVTTTGASKPLHANSVRAAPAVLRTRSETDLRRTFCGDSKILRLIKLSDRTLSESDMRSFPNKRSQNDRGKNGKKSQHETEGKVANTSGVTACTAGDSAPEKDATTSGFSAATTSEDHGGKQAAGTTGNNTPEQAAGTSGNNDPEQAAGTSGNNDPEQAAGTSGNNDPEQAAGTSGNNNPEQAAGTSGNNDPEQAAGTRGNNDPEQAAGTSGNNDPEQAAGTSGNNDPEQAAGTSGNNDPEQTAGTSGNNDPEQTAGTSGNNDPEQTAGTSGNNDPEQTAGTSGNNDPEQAAGTSGNNDPEQAAGTSGNNDPEQAAGTRGNNDPEQAAGTSGNNDPEQAAGTSGNNNPEQAAGTSGNNDPEQAAGTRGNNDPEQTAGTSGNNDPEQAAGTSGNNNPEQAAGTSGNNDPEQAAGTRGNNDPEQAAGTSGNNDPEQAAGTSGNNDPEQAAGTSGNNDPEQAAGTRGNNDPEQAAGTSGNNDPEQAAGTSGNNDPEQAAGTRGNNDPEQAAGTSGNNDPEQAAGTSGNNDPEQAAGTSGNNDPEQAAGTSGNNDPEQAAGTSGNNDPEQAAGTSGNNDPEQAAGTSGNNDPEQAAGTRGNNDPEQAAGTSGNNDPEQAAGTSGNNDPEQAAGTSGNNDPEQAAGTSFSATANFSATTSFSATANFNATASSSGSTASLHNANRSHTGGKSNRGKPRGCKNNRPPKQTRQDKKEANKEALRLARGETSEAASFEGTVKMRVDFRNANSLELVTADNPYFNKKEGTNKGRRNRRNLVVLDQDPTVREYNMKFFKKLNATVHEMITNLFISLNTIVVKGYYTPSEFEDTRIFMDLIVKLLDEIQKWNRMAHTAMRIDTESPTWAAENLILQTRRDICFSQALTAAAAGVLSWVTTTPEDIVVRIVQSGLGPLLEFEGLLSMYAEERTMWGDMVIAVEDLHTLTFKFVPVTSSSPIIPQVIGSRGALVIEIPIMGSLFSKFENMDTPPTFTVTAAFFNIGINDKASLAEALGDNKPQFQSNKDSFERIYKYYLKYCQVFPQDPSEQLRALSHSRPLEEVMENLHSAIIRRTSKNVEILHLAALATRQMHGVRFTSCKSAKDRTGMSVSLEQATILSDEYHMTDHERKPALDIMRSEGCRRENTVKNIGQRKYAFTKQQVTALPVEYRPPHGTYGAGIHET